MFGPAAAHGIAILFPDTSPRGAGIEGEDTDWDFGTGAGFYLNATNPKYSKHYNMYTHVTLELPNLLESFPIVRTIIIGIVFSCSLLRVVGLEPKVYLWTQHGRTWGFDHLSQQHLAVQIRISTFFLASSISLVQKIHDTTGIFSYLQPNEMPLG